MLILFFSQINYYLKVIYKMFEIAILYVISVLVSGCNQKKSKVKDVVRDTDNKEVKNIEEIKKRFKLKDVKDLIFIPIKKNRCIVWNNYYYRHAVFSNSPRLMIGPINESIQEVGVSAVGKQWRKAYPEREDNLIPIRYGKNHDVCFHHDSNPKTKKINELSMLVYLENVDDGYFILEKSKECGKVYVDGDPRLASPDFLERPEVVEGLNGKPADIWEDLEIDKEYVECGGKLINIKQKNYCITKLELDSDFNKNIKKIKKNFDNEAKWSDDQLVETHRLRLGKIEEISPNNNEECKNSQMESGRSKKLPFGWSTDSFYPEEDTFAPTPMLIRRLDLDDKSGRLSIIGNEPLKSIGKWSKRPNNNFVYLYEDKDNKIKKKLKGKLENCDIRFI